MIKLIICDIGGVLEDFTELAYVNYICGKLGINKEEFGRSFMPMLEKAESGKERTSDMLKVLAKKFSVKVDDLKFSTSLAKLAKLDMNMVELLNALHKNYTVVLLTNVSRSRYLQNTKIGLFEEVEHDGIFASCYLRMAKPKHRIYRYVLDKMRVDPGDAVFIDDRMVNVRGAREVGIHGIQFKGYRPLMNDLRKMGIKWEA